MPGDVETGSKYEGDVETEANARRQTLKLEANARCQTLKLEANARWC
jgi:hypothetical protein